jgi:CheY-like chemotaxis protein
VRKQVLGTAAAVFPPMMISEKERPPPLSGIRTRAARVLVVDDEPMVAKSLQLVLSSEFDVSRTSESEKALEMLSSGESFDVILCDVMMPNMNGVELRNRVEQFSQDQAARIVFITGGLLLPQVRVLLDSVPNTCLEKPIDLEGLRELIRRRVRAHLASAEQ